MFNVITPYYDAYVAPRPTPPTYLFTCASFRLRLYLFTEVSGEKEGSMERISWIRSKRFVRIGIVYDRTGAENCI